MRSPRCYIGQALLSDAELELPEAPSNHLLRVLRLRPGAPLTLFNGLGGEYQAQLLSDSGRRAHVRVAEYRALERESPLQLTLIQSIARGERMDMIVQKATELGVARIVPVLSEFSIVRLDARQAQRRREHWQAIVVGACEQCGRNRLPEIAAISDFTAAITATDGIRLLLSPTGGTSLGAVAQLLTAATLLIGPEGGLSAREETLATEQGFAACRLGPRVLRTETAPIAAIAILQALSGDLLRS